MSVLGNLLFTVLFFSQFLNFFPGLLFIYLFLSKIWNKQSYEMAFRAGSAVRCSTASPALGAELSAGEMLSQCHSSSFCFGFGLFSAL